MRIKHFPVLLALIILILVFIPYTFAEDNSQRNLPGVAFARLGKGHILDLAYSPDGKQLAVAGSIGIWIYDVETLQINAHLTDFAGKIFSVSYSPDGKTIAGTSTDRAILLWDAQTGVLRNILRGNSELVCVSPLVQMEILS